MRVYAKERKRREEKRRWWQLNYNFVMRYIRRCLFWMFVARRRWRRRPRNSILLLLFVFICAVINKSSLCFPFAFCKHSRLPSQISGVLLLLLLPRHKAISPRFLRISSSLSFYSYSFWRMISILKLWIRTKPSPLVFCSLNPSNSIRLSDDAHH